MDALPPAYFISRDPVREAQLRAACSACGLESLHKWTPFMAKWNPRMGNSISHYSLTQHLYETGVNDAIILEDDAIPCDQILDELPKELDECRKEGVTALRIGWAFEKPNMILGSHAYVLLSREGMVDWMKSLGTEWKMDLVFDHMETLAMQSSKCYFAQYVPKKSLVGIHGARGKWFGDMECIKPGVTFKKASAALGIPEPF